MEPQGKASRSSTSAVKRGDEGRCGKALFPSLRAPHRRMRASPPAARARSVLRNRRAIPKGMETRHRDKRSGREEMRSAWSCGALTAGRALRSPRAGHLVRSDVAPTRRNLGFARQPQVLQVGPHRGKRR